MIILNVSSGSLLEYVLFLEALGTISYCISAMTVLLQVSQGVDLKIQKISECVYICTHILVKECVYICTHIS